VNPSNLASLIRAERFHLIVTTDNVHSPNYRSSQFGLPEQLAAEVRRHYRLWKSTDRPLYLYIPNSAANSIDPSANP
jgi:hypothetical protein